jgi:hypothetical protein
MDAFFHACLTKLFGIRRLSHVDPTDWRAAVFAVIDKNTQTMSASYFVLDLGPARLSTTHLHSISYFKMSIFDKSKWLERSADITWGFNAYTELSLVYLEGKLGYRIGKKRDRSGWFEFRGYTIRVLGFI